MIDQTNNKNKNPSVKVKRSRGSERRGVGAIIGGVILIAILTTSVLVYFVTIANNEKTKTGLELNALSGANEKQTEKYLVSRNSTITAGNLGVQIINNGPIPMVASTMLVYCTNGLGCTDPRAPTPMPLTPPLTLNAGESSPQQMIPVSNGNSYRIDVISERGNIVSSTECIVNTGVCEEDGAGEGGGDPGVIPDGVIQGTGSLQLDFKSFGVIYPQYQVRNGIDQTGFSSRAGNATGYPAFMVPAGPQTYLVERVRNLDPEGNTINLNRSSGMTISQGKCTSGQCAPVYLCSATNDINGNIVAGTVAALNDPTINVSIPATPLTADINTGWQDLVLCSNAQNSVGAWNVQGQMSNINSAFMVARGTYAGTNFPYAQTIPYQSIIVANQGAPNLGNNGIVNANMVACLRDSNVATPCVTPTALDASGTLRYHATAGSTFWVHVNNNCICGYNLSWISPGTGVVQNLATGLALNGNNNLNTPTPFTVPAVAPGFYTIMLTTGYNAGGERDAYHFTFRVD